MDKNAILSAEDFNTYIRKLPSEEKCTFMVESVVQLCDCNFICPYKGKETYAFRGKRMRECNREKILRYKKLLGDKI